MEFHSIKIHETPSGLSPVQAIDSLTAPGWTTRSVPVWLQIETLKLANVSQTSSLDKIIIIFILRSSLHLSSTLCILLASWYILCLASRLADWTSLFGDLSQLSV